MARNFGRGRGRNRRDRFEDGDGENKYSSLSKSTDVTGPSSTVNTEEAKQAEIAQEVAVVEAKAEQPSIEDKRLISAGVTPEEKQKQITSQAALAQTEELIRTPQDLKDRMAIPTNKLPAMNSDIDPEDTSLPATQDVATDDITADTTKPMEAVVSMYHGGMMSPVGLMGPDGIVGYDPVSGNPIPIGSSPENVRDDIPAALSQGEYVVPADVVSYFGLRHFMDMRQEAKMGLMAMHAEGQIHDDYSEEVDTEQSDSDEEDMAVCPQCDGEGCDHCDGEGYHEDTDVEQAEFVTVEEELPLKEDSEGVVEYATEGGQFTVGDEQVLMIFKSMK